jgi:O-antigen/teichoic acid export membrane protein
MNMILTSSSFIFPLVTVPYVSRVLGVHGTGAVAFAQSVTGYFSLFAMMGISVYGVRECAKVRDDRSELSQLVQELLIILLGTTTIVFLVYLCALFSVPQLSSDKELMLIFSIGIWLFSFGVEWFFQAIEQYGYITIRNILFKFLALGLMLIFVREASDYRVYGLITVIAGYGSNIVNLLRLRKFISFKKRKRWNLKRHFKPMLSFTVSSISSGLYSSIDIVMLGFLGTTSMVGIYQLAFKIKNVLGAAIGSVGNVMLPRLSYFTQDGRKKEFEDLIAKNFSFILTCGLALVSLCMLCSKEIVLVLGGSAFRESAKPLVAIAPILVLSPLNTLLSQHMIATGKERAYASVNFVTLLCSIALSFFFIPKLGFVGAGLSVTLSEFFALFVRFIILHDFVIPVVKRLELWKQGISCTLAVILTLLLGNVVAGQPTLVVLLVVSTAYCVVYFAGLLLLHEQIFMNLIRGILVSSRRKTSRQ